MAIEDCDESISGAVLQTLAASNHKCRPCNDQRPQIPAGIPYEIRLKNRLQSQWQVTKDSALKADVNCLQSSVTRRLSDSLYDQWSTTLDSLDPDYQWLWRLTKRIMRVPTPFPLR
jgi:hypothetical protein